MPAFTYEAPLIAGFGSANTTQAPEPFVPAAVGTYRWTAEYSGDDFYRGATEPCNAPNEQTVVIEQSTPVLTTEASKAS